LTIYNLIGQEVATVVDAYQSAGSFLVTIEARGLSSGSYFYVMRAGDVELSRKMLLY